MPPMADKENYVGLDHNGGLLRPTRGKQTKQISRGDQKQMIIKDRIYYGSELTHCEREIIWLSQWAPPDLAEYVSQRIAELEIRREELKKKYYAAFKEESQCPK